MGKTRRTTGTMASVIRKAFADSGWSMKRLSEESSTRYASVHGFFATQDRDPALSTVDQWCKALGLELIP